MRWLSLSGPRQASPTRSTAELRHAFSFSTEEMQFPPAHAKKEGRRIALTRERRNEVVLRDLTPAGERDADGGWHFWNTRGS
jgi:hypothetical protein